MQRKNGRELSVTLHDSCTSVSECHLVKPKRVIDTLTRTRSHSSKRVAFLSNELSLILNLVWNPRMTHINAVLPYTQLTCNPHNLSIDCNMIFDKFSMWFFDSLLSSPSHFSLSNQPTCFYVTICNAIFYAKKLRIKNKNCQKSWRAFSHFWHLLYSIFITSFSNAVCDMLWPDKWGL